MPESVFGQSLPGFVRHVFLGGHEGTGKVFEGTPREDDAALGHTD